MTETNQARWRWTLASGLLTLLLAVCAIFLPDIEWAPRGSLVGWLLLAAGIAELVFATGRRDDPVGQASLGSGVLTAAAGALFIASPTAGYFQVTTVVTAWLVIRGAWMLAMSIRIRPSVARTWLAASGVTDILLGLVLVAGLPVSALVVSLFGPTREIVARFALLLAASFAVTGISQIVIALARRQPPDHLDG